jgi:phage terminase large subunit-like protein
VSRKHQSSGPNQETLELREKNRALKSKADAFDAIIRAVVQAIDEETSNEVRKQVEDIMSRTKVIS